MSASAGTARAERLRPPDPMGSLTRIGPAYLAFVALLLAVVLAALTVLVTRQWRLGLGVTGLNNSAVWGLYIANFVFLIGTSAGGILVASLVHAFGVRRFEPVGRIAELIALGSLLMAMAFIVLDLGKPSRFLNLLIHGRVGSPLVWDFWIMAIYLAITAALGYFATRSDMVIAMGRFPRRRWLYRILTLGYTDISAAAVARDRRWLRVLAVLAIPGAVGLHSITAWLLGLIKAQPGWHNPLLAPLFIVSAAVSGLAMVTVVVVLARRFLNLAIRDDLITALGRTLLWMLPVLGYLLFSELLTTLFAREPSRLNVFQDMIYGRFAPVFWFDLVVGLLLPGLLLLLGRKSVVLTGLSAAMVVAGVYAERVLIVLPSQLNRAFPSRISHYAPTGTEWLLVAGVWALGVLVFTLLSKVFPLVPTAEEA